MNWLEAMRKVVKEGGKVTRETWGDKDIYVSMHDGYLSIRMKEVGKISEEAEFEGENSYKFHSWLVSEADAYAHDWRDACDA